MLGQVGQFKNSEQARRGSVKSLFIGFQNSPEGLTLSKKEGTVLPMRQELSKIIVLRRLS